MTELACSIVVSNRYCASRIGRCCQSRKNVVAVGGCRRVRIADRGETIQRVVRVVSDGAVVIGSLRAVASRVVNERHSGRAPLVLRHSAKRVVMKFCSNLPAPGVASKQKVNSHLSYGKHTQHCACNPRVR